MQKIFKRWLKEFKESHIETQLDFYDPIRKKLINIAENNNYKLIYENFALGKENGYLFFRNRETQKFLAAKTNKEGFFSEEERELW